MGEVEDCLLASVKGDCVAIIVFLEVRFGIPFPQYIFHLGAGSVLKKWIFFAQYFYQVEMLIHRNLRNLFSLSIFYWI